MPILHFTRSFNVRLTSQLSMMKTNVTFYTVDTEPERALLDCMTMAFEVNVKHVKREIFDNWCKKKAAII